MARNVGPRSLDATYTMQLFEHTPNERVSGLFGTFKQLMEPSSEVSGRMVERRVKVSRENIHVFNVHLLKNHVLSLASLRALARALPNEYPMPSEADIPDSHVEMDERPPERPRAAVRRKPPNRAKSAPSSSSSSESAQSASSESSSEEEQDKSSERNGDDCFVNRSQAIPKQPQSEHEMEEVDDTDDESGASETESDWTPTAQSLGFAIVLGDDDSVVSKMTYPAVPVYIEEIRPPNEENQAPTALVRWYGGSTKSFKSGNDVEFPKWWSDPLWAIKGKKRNKNFQVTLDLIKKYWTSDFIEIDTLLRLDVPRSAYDHERLFHKGKRGDNIVISGEFMKNEVVKACKRQGCVSN